MIRPTGAGNYASKAQTEENDVIMLYKQNNRSKVLLRY